MATETQNRPSHVLEDPSAKAVARVYAVAFLDAVAATGTTESLGELTSFWDEVLKPNPEALRILTSEVTSREDKLGIIERGRLLHAGTREELMARARAHPVISVQVVGDPLRAEQVLRRDRRVDRVEHTDGELHVTLHDATLHHHFLIELLIAHDVQIHSVAPHQLKLEDVFLRLTKGIVQ